MYANYTFYRWAGTDRMSKEVEERRVSREEAADELQKIADALRADDTLDMTINNRTIHLSPADEIAVEVSVHEKSSLLRGNREGVTVKLDWKPQ